MDPVDSHHMLDFTSNESYGLYCPVQLSKHNADFVFNFKKKQIVCILFSLLLLLCEQFCLSWFYTVILRYTVEIEKMFYFSVWLLKYTQNYLNCRVILYPGLNWSSSCCSSRPPSFDKPETISKPLCTVANLLWRVAELFSWGFCEFIADTTDVNWGSQTRPFTTIRKCLPRHK